MGVLPRDDTRTFTEPLTVECARCGAKKLVSARKRNDHRWPGEFCDGPAPRHREDRTRHPLTPMVGPEGLRYA